MNRVMPLTYCLRCNQPVLWKGRGRRPKYCSDKCQVAAYNKAKYGSHRHTHCVYCGAEIAVQKNRKYCDAVCRVKANGERSRRWEALRKESQAKAKAAALRAVDIWLDQYASKRPYQTACALMREVLKYVD